MHFLVLAGILVQFPYLNLCWASSEQLGGGPLLSSSLKLRFVPSALSSPPGASLLSLRWFFFLRGITEPSSVTFKQVRLLAETVEPRPPRLPRGGRASALGC